MIRLEMTAREGHIDVNFDAPDSPGEPLRLDELAVFALHLDVIKDRIIALTNTLHAPGVDIATEKEAAR